MGGRDRGRERKGRAKAGSERLYSVTHGLCAINVRPQLPRKTAARDIVVTFRTKMELSPTFHR